MEGKHSIWTGYILNKDVGSIDIYILLRSLAAFSSPLSRFSIGHTQNTLSLGYIGYQSESGVSLSLTLSLSLSLSRRLEELLRDELHHARAQREHHEQLLFALDRAQVPRELCDHDAELALRRLMQPEDRPHVL